MRYRKVISFSIGDIKNRPITTSSKIISEIYGAVQMRCTNIRVITDTNTFEMLRSTVCDIKIDTDVIYIGTPNRVTVPIYRKNIVAGEVEILGEYDTNTVNPQSTDYMNECAVKKSYSRKINRGKIPPIRDVMFNNPATIVFWEDGSKTVVKACKGDTFDKEKGLAMAIIKHLCGDKGSYNNIFAKYVKDGDDSVVTETLNNGKGN